MARSLDEKGGVGVYSRNIITELLRIDRNNEYLLLYRNPSHIGLFAGSGNVHERLVGGSNKVYWDQIAVPMICRKEKVDLIFHPKFTAPLLAPCKAVMVVHGADWLIPEQARYYSFWDVRVMKLMLPLYFKKSAAVISVSQETTANFNRLLKPPPGKIITVYFAPARHFQRVTEREVLESTRERYGLPDRFILTLTKLNGDRRKNFGQLLAAYAAYHQDARDPHKLVVGGADCHLLKPIYGIPEDGYGRDIYFPGWIDQADMPAVYSLADLYLYPSNLEAFPIPLTEAMACGTPILTSNVNGLQEIAGEAAIRVDPSDTRAIASGIAQILDDPELRARLTNQGLERSSRFSWDECARSTLAVLEQTVQG
jgi:glycosyltransferase involved in cell wall biosynthesis